MQGSDKVVVGLSAKTPSMVGKAAGLMEVPVGDSARQVRAVWMVGLGSGVRVWDEVVGVGGGRV
jgi:hypothetical protein